MTNTDPFAKDCACVTHGGPHWLHMFVLDRKKHERDVEALVDAIQQAGRDPADPALSTWIGAMTEHVAKQGTRLYGELAKEMEARGIERIPDHMFAVARHPFVGEISADEPRPNARLAALLHPEAAS